MTAMGRAIHRYELRQATPDDYAFMRDVKLSGIRPYVEEIWGWDPVDQEDRFRESFAPDRQQLIRCDGQDVGMLELEDRDDCLFLAGIFIAAAHRSSGLGTKIIQDVQARAQLHGKPVRLRVLRPNPARRLYERLGFRLVEESETHFTMEA